MRYQVIVSNGYFYDLQLGKSGCSFRPSKKLLFARKVFKKQTPPVAPLNFFRDRMDVHAEIKWWIPTEPVDLFIIKIFPPERFVSSLLSVRDAMTSRTYTQKKIHQIAYVVSCNILMRTRPMSNSQNVA